MNPKLLIVDDDEEIRTQMKWALAAITTSSWPEDRASAIEAFQSVKPLVVLLDLGLPPRPGDPEEGLAALADLLAIGAPGQDCRHHRPGRKEHRPAGHWLRALTIS